MGFRQQKPWTSCVAPKPTHDHSGSEPQVYRSLFLCPSPCQPYGTGFYPLVELKPYDNNSFLPLKPVVETGAIDTFRQPLLESPSPLALDVP